MNAKKKWIVLDKIDEEPADEIDAVFKQFSPDGSVIDGKVFAKLAKDCNILNEKCTTTDIFIIFKRVKEKHNRKINFDQFKKALKLCAEKRKESYASLEAKILGPRDKK